MFLETVWRAKFLEPLHYNKVLGRNGQPALRFSPARAELTDAIRNSWRRETSDDPQVWSRDNPSRGQCAVTALIVQDFWGGDLLQQHINLTAHFWNLLPDCRELDLTKDQFRSVLVFAGAPVKISRQFVLAFPGTRRNYRLLRRLVLDALHTQVRDSR